MKHFDFDSVSVLCALLCAMLVPGCKKAKAPDASPQTAPDPAQLESSRLWQFARGLRAMPVSERDLAAQRFLKDNPATPLVEGNGVAGFFWYGKAAAVSINGDLQHGWATPDTLEAIPCGENVFFLRVYLIPPDARLDYLLSIDGQETPDPRNPRVTASFYGPRSEIVMPQFKPNPLRQFRGDIKHGTIDTIALNSTNQLIKPRTIQVYTPPGAKELGRLPTLYVTDGIEALDYMSYTNVLDNLIADGKIRPVVVVFIGTAKEDMALFPDKFSVLAGAICDELVPLIDRSYPTEAVPAGRAITGISVFGNLACLTVFIRPDIFSMAAGQSATITKGLMAMPGRAGNHREGLDPLRIYLDVGNYDLGGGALDNHSFLKANELFSEEIERNHIEHRFRAYNDGHSWGNWRERTDAILCYFFPPAGH
jgi:enterochelin esterase-like enzyme